MQSRTGRVENWTGSVRRATSFINNKIAVNYIDRFGIRDCVKGNRRENFCFSKFHRLFLLLLLLRFYDLFYELAFAIAVKPCFRLIDTLLLKCRFVNEVADIVKLLSKRLDRDRQKENKSETVLVWFRNSQDFAKIEQLINPLRQLWWARIDEFSPVILLIRANSF